MAAAAATATAVVLVPAAPAQADTIITSMSCSSENFTISCAITYEAPPPVTIDWMIGGSSITAYRNSATMSTGCTGAGHGYTITATLAGADSLPVQSQARVDCSGGGPTRIGYFDCDTGGARIRCYVNIADGKPPFSITWEVNGSIKPVFNDRQFLDMSCIVDREFYVKVLVRDAYGRHATDSNGCVCQVVHP